jgi:acetate kinase
MRHFTEISRDFSRFLVLNGEFHSKICEAQILYFMPKKKKKKKKEIQKYKAKNANMDFKYLINFVDTIIFFQIM